MKKIDTKNCLVIITDDGRKLQYWKSDTCCPMCMTTRLFEDDVMNAHSQYDDTSICSSCATMEAMTRHFRMS